MKKKKITLLLSLFLQHTTSFAQKYIQKTQNIYLKDNDNDNDDISFDENLNPLQFNQIINKITKIRSSLYRCGLFIKKKKFYDKIIINLSKFYLKKIKQCSDDEEKKRIIKEYQFELTKIMRSRDSKNLFQLIGVEEENINIKTNISLLKNKLRSYGFFDGTIETKTNIVGDNLFVDYIIQKNKRYTINSYTIESSIDLLKNTNESFIHVGEGYNVENLLNEKRRIFLLLKNSGYVFFKNQYINFFITQNSENKILDIELKFLTKEENSLTPYNFETINLKVENGKNIKKPSLYREVKYYNTGRFGKKILYRFIPFKPGEQYTLKKENLFIKKILQTGVFRNAYISHELDENGKLSSTIYIVPEKKFEKYVDIGFKQKLKKSNFEINPCLSQKLSIKNFLSSLETINLGCSIFGNLWYEKGFILAPELQLEGVLSFPYFFLFLLLKEKTSKNWQISTEFRGKIKRLPNKRNLFASSSEEEKNGKNIPMDNLSFKLVYNFIYKNHNLDLNIIPSKQVDFKKKSDSRINSYLSKKIKLHYLWNFEGRGEKNNSFLDNSFEFSLCSKKSGTLTQKKLEHDKYIKNVFTFKKTFKLPNRWEFSTRAIFGGIYIFKNSSDTKHHMISPKIYFGAGGRTTVRGYDFEVIGPGRTLSISKKKKGEILICFNNELRKKITDVIELATFVDIGNTWKRNSPRKRENINNLLKDLFVGVGMGLRLNFKLVVLSFDLGVPVRGPVTVPQDFAFYIGLSYPF